jgi:hypothetical protein
VRAAQGYVFSPPLPGGAFLQLVEAIDPAKIKDSAAAGRPPAVPPAVLRTGVA